MICNRAWISVIVACAILLTLSAQFAQAQSLRTWVSGVGDDANPGSRTAPCKTFGGCISKTAAGGEIDCLDPGGFGAVTITKSITIDGGGTFASILGAGTNAITINAGVNDVVTIKRLSINGGGTGLNGIRFIAGGALHIEDCVIFNFTQKGIDFEPAGISQLFVQDCVIRNNNNAVNGGAIFMKPGVGGNVTATIDRVRMNGNKFGVVAQVSANVVIRNSTIASSAGNGVNLSSPTSPINIFLEKCLISSNGGNGIVANGAQSTVRISNNTITNNNVGLATSNSGSIISFGNNRIAGNATNGAPTSTIPLL